MVFHDWATRGLAGYDLWNTYGSEELAIDAKRKLEYKGYKVKIKMIEDIRHNFGWNVYYKY